MEVLNDVKNIRKTRELIKYRYAFKKAQKKESIKLQNIDSNENAFSLGVKKAQDLQIFVREMQYGEMGFQAIPERINKGTNTNYTIHKQKIIQTDMQIVERKLDYKQEQRLYKFLQEIFGTLEESLIENEVVKVYEDDLDIGYEKGESRDSGSQLSIIKELKSFEFEKCNQKNVSCIQFLPKYNFMAVSLIENFTFEERVDISSRSFNSYILIWDYEEYHRFTPVAMLESPLEFTSFQFKPDNPEYLVAGAVNGQVFLFDLKQLNLKKKFSDIVDNVKSTKDNKEIKKFKPILSSSIIESYSATQKLIQTEPITRKPLFLSSHKTTIKSLLFLPKNVALDKKNPFNLIEVQEDENLPRDQFATLSADGQILFWSLDLNDIKDKQTLSLNEFDFTKVNWKALLSIQLFDEYKNALQTNYLLNLQDQSNTFLYCADINGSIIKIDFDIQKNIQIDAQKIEVIKEVKTIETQQVVIEIDINNFIEDFFLVITETCFYLYYKDIETPIFVSTFLQNSKITCGTFSTYRPSIVYIGKSDGILDVWDFSDSIGNPSQQHLVSAIGIDYIQVHQKKPNLLAVGDKASCIHLLNLPKSLYRLNQNELQTMKNWIEIQSKKKQYYQDQFQDLIKEEQGTQNNEQDINNGLQIQFQNKQNKDQQQVNFQQLYKEFIQENFQEENQEEDQ